MTRKEIEKAVAMLFVNGFGEEADRLMLVDKSNKDLGGWCKEAVIDRLCEALKIP